MDKCTTHHHHHRLSLSKKIKYPMNTHTHTQNNLIIIKKALIIKLSSSFACFFRHDMH